MSFPDVSLPKAPDPALDPAGYLRSIYAVRERTKLVLEKAKKNQLKHFTVDMSKFHETATYVVSIIKVCTQVPRPPSLLIPRQRDYAPDYASIPPHGRWQHFDVGGRPRIDQLMASWPMTVDNQERTRRLIDLFLVSVLLDAGAGTKWQYRSKESGRFYRRSEGLAVASLEMFKAGLFSSDPNEPCQVDSGGLRRLDIQTLARGLQVTDSNPIDGLQGRGGLLMKLGDALQNQEVFGLEQRPGNMLGTQSILKTGSCADHCRLPTFTPFNTGFLCAHHSLAHSVEHTHGQPGSHLASHAHHDRRHLYW
jgi:hypothetical protein